MLTLLYLAGASLSNYLSVIFWIQWPLSLSRYRNRQGDRWDSLFDGGTGGIEGDLERGRSIVGELDQWIYTDWWRYTYCFNIKRDQTVLFFCFNPLIKIKILIPLVVDSTRLVHSTWVTRGKRGGGGDNPPSLDSGVFGLGTTQCERGGVPSPHASGPRQRRGREGVDGL
jgi:hypothetical protein